MSSKHSTQNKLRTENIPKGQFLISRKPPAGRLMAYGFFVGLASAAVTGLMGLSGWAVVLSYVVGGSLGVIVPTLPSLRRRNR